MFNLVHFSDWLNNSWFNFGYSVQIISFQIDRNSKFIDGNLSHETYRRRTIAILLIENGKQNHYFHSAHPLQVDLKQ